MLLWVSLVVGLGQAKKYVIVPPLDPFDFPEKFYQPVPDPNQSILDRSLAEDALDWRQFQVEFQRTPHSGPVEGEKFLVTSADGIEYSCQLPSAPPDQSSNEVKSMSERKRLKKWRKALDPLRRKSLVYVQSILYNQRIISRIEVGMVDV